LLALVSTVGKTAVGAALPPQAARNKATIKIKPELRRIDHSSSGRCTALKIY
jgi:hypothetical protein